MIHEEANAFRYDTGHKDRPAVCCGANRQIAFKPQPQALGNGFGNFLVVNRYDLGFHTSIFPKRPGRQRPESWRLRASSLGAFHGRKNFKQLVQFGYFEQRLDPFIHAHKK